MVKAINYRTRAVELRELAEQTRIQQAREDALRVAAEWERLAEIAERAARAKSQH